MRFCALAFFLTWLPLAGMAQDRLSIDEVGLRGYYSPSVPAAVRVHIPQLKGSVTAELEFVVTSSDTHQLQQRVDRFEKVVQMRSGEAFETEVPLLMPKYERVDLSVILRDSVGRRMDETRWDVNSVFPISDVLIAIYCKNPRLCQEAQRQIATGGTEAEITEKGAKFRFVDLDAPREHWWAYRAARAVVLAGPIAGFSQEQRRAVEYYLRSGGTLLLLEKELADQSFLSAYRQGDRTSDPVFVGTGRLYRVPNLESNKLGAIATGEGVQALINVETPWNSSADAVLSRFGTSFTFPSLRRLIMWLVAYILLVGPLNFALLHRFRRLEWGWATIAIISLVFGGQVYFSSSARRPKNFTVDDVNLYWMDGRSDNALKQSRLRVSSPDRRSLSIAYNDDVVIEERDWFQQQQAGDDLDIGASATEKRRQTNGWDAELGPPIVIRAPILSWSFRDVGFTSFREFPGTIRQMSTTRLRNDTGQRFRDATYLDFTTYKRYSIHMFGTGDEIDLASIPAQDIPRRGYWPPGELIGLVENQSKTARSTYASSVAQIPGSGLGPGFAKHVFIGVTEGTVPLGTLQGVSFDSRSISFVVVSLDSQ